MDVTRSKLAFNVIYISFRGSSREYRFYAEAMFFPSREASSSRQVTSSLNERIDRLFTFPRWRVISRFLVAALRATRVPSHREEGGEIIFPILQ